MFQLFFSIEENYKPNHFLCRGRKSQFLHSGGVHEPNPHEC